jgi:N6-adenosine-specific RNA methylase IME4
MITGRIRDRSRGRDFEMSGQIQPRGLLMPGAPRPKHHPLANLFPMLADERRDSFRTSLAEQQNHPIVLHMGMILDGRNRERELVELGKPVSYVVFTGSSREAFNFVMAENLERRHLTESQRAMVAAKAATMRLGDNQHSAPPAQICAPNLFEDATDDPAKEVAGVISQTEAGEMLNVSRRSVQSATTVLEKAAPELQEAVEQGRIAVSTAAEFAKSIPQAVQAQIAAMSEKDILAKAKEIRKDQNDKRRGERVEKLKAQSAGNTALNTQRKFPVIYLDPPTKFAAGDSDRSTENHYPTMDEAQIAALPIGDLATDDAVMFIWTTVPWLRKTMTLIEGWGFAYVSEIVWDKQVLGLGFWNRNVHETLLIATRGKMPAPDPSTLKPSLYSEARTRHSAKPEYFRDLITAYYPDLPKVELFSRVDGAIDENDCPGHVASEADPKVCGHCGVHIDSLRPDEEEAA